MTREGWIHGLAFLAVLAVGVLLIGPRLVGRSGRTTPPGTDPLTGGVPEARRAGPEVEAFEARAGYDWIAVRVSGEGGPLRGPFRAVEGADVEAETAPDAAVQRLRIRPRGHAVAFGAVGHQWRTFPTSELHTRAEAGEVAVELPTAAPSVIVRVREADGSPAPDVPLRVLPPSPGGTPRTDAGGTVVLDHLAPGLVVVDASTAERRGPRLRLLAGADRDVRLDLEPAWRVRGRVVDREGAPLTGARVEALGPAGTLGTIVTTGGDGRFTWTGPAVARLAVRVRAPGLAEHGVEAAPPAVGPLETDLGDVRLAAAGVTLVGTVAAAWREADAHVLVEPAVAAPVRELFGEGQVLDRPRRAPLAEDGSFRFHDLPAGLPLRVSVRGAGVPVDAIVEGRPGEEVAVALEPPPGERLVGRLLRPDGGPAAGVRLLVSDVPRDGDGLEAGDVEVPTGADGTFARRGLAARTWFLRAYAPGCRSLLRRVTLPLDAPLALAFEPSVPDAGRRVEGRVHDGVRSDVRTKGDDPWVGESTDVRFGRPLAGVTVQAAGVEARTDAEGRFRLEGVESLSSDVRLAYGFEPGRATAEDPRPYVPSDTVGVRPGGPPLELVLWRGATLRFRAVDAIDDRPLSFVHVVVRTDRGRVVFDRGVAPIDGEVVLRDLPPRGVDLAILARDRRYRRAPLPLRPGETLDLGDVLLSHGVRVSGRVLGPDGAGLAGARVGAFGRGWQHAGEDPGGERELLFRTTVADADGRFSVEGFDPRQHVDLAVWARGWAPAWLRVQRPPPGRVEVEDVEVGLVGGGFLVLDLRGLGSLRERAARVHGAFLDLEHANEGSDWLDLVHRGLMGGPLGDTGRWREVSEQLLHERRGADGYVLGPVRPGPYSLWVERPGYLPRRMRLTVIDPGATLRGSMDVEKEGLYGIEAHVSQRATRIELELERAP